MWLLKLIKAYFPSFDIDFFIAHNSNDMLLIQDRYLRWFKNKCDTFSLIILFVLFHLPSRSLFECSCEIVPIHFALVINNLKLLLTLTTGLFLIITNKFNDRANIFSCCIANECFKYWLSYQLGTGNSPCCWNFGKNFLYNYCVDKL
jgi:hypothetical protein